MNNKTYFNIVHAADTSGCGFYRMKTPYMALQNVNKNIFVADSPKMIPLPEFYNDVRHVRVQRQCSTAQVDFVEKFLMPLSNTRGFWVSFEIDDIIIPDYIPAYNLGRDAYLAPGISDNIKRVMSVVDFITVTTDELAKTYSAYYNIPLNKFKVIPNYLPRWWVGNNFNIKLIEEKYDKQVKSKFKIVFAGSTSHFDIKNRNNGVDDYTHIIPFILKNYKKYEFVFIGGFPQQIKHLIETKEITFITGFDLWNYPQHLNRLDASLFIAPLQDNMFNRNKSNIKLLESWALGVPVLTQNITTYSQYTDMTFEDHNDIEQKVINLLYNKNRYLKTCKDNYDIIENGDVNAKNGWWLENNLQDYTTLFTMSQKSLEININ